MLIVFFPFIRLVCYDCNASLYRATLLRLPGGSSPQLCITVSIYIFFLPLIFFPSPFPLNSCFDSIFLLV